MAVSRPGERRTGAQPAHGDDSRPERAPRRIGGIDAARALAIVGMVAVHFGPTGVQAEGDVGRLYSLSHGRAAILFAVLAGVGVTLLAGDGSRRRRHSAWAHLAFRAAVLLPLGLALQMLHHNVLVILQYYALYFLIAGAAVALADRVLLGLAAAVMALGPVAYLAAWRWRPPWFDGEPTTLASSPAVIARDLVLNGAYPALTWAAPVLFGMWVGRRRLRSTAVRRRMVLGGAAAAVAAWAAAKALELWLGTASRAPSWGYLAVDDPHSQMPLWLIGATGAATAVLGACLMLVDRVPRLSWPLVAAGQLALSIYVGQLLALTAWPGLLRRGEVLEASLTVAAFMIGAAAAAALWLRFWRRGPLEAVLRLPWALRAR